MANEEHLAILRQGVEVWNEWRKVNGWISPDLTAANLTAANLFRADLREADLTGTNLREASLIGTNLRMSNLTGTNLSRTILRAAILRGAMLTKVDLSAADLTGVDFSGAGLIEVDLSAADLTGVDFTAALLTKVDLTNARIGTTMFADINFREVKGLDTVRHFGPSTIGIDTLYKSGGKIPEVFLRGCGVPDSLIEYLPSLLGAMQPIQFYSCFISYSSKDEDFAQRLYSRMRDNHLRVWFANEDMKAELFH